MTDSSEPSHACFWAQLAKRGRADIEQLIEEARQTLPARVEAAFRQGAAHDGNGQLVTDRQLFDRMWLGEGLEQVNRELHDDLSRDLETLTAYKRDTKNSPAYGLYHLSRNARLISFYFCFADGSQHFPGRLSRDNQELLMELLWCRTMEKNDIAISRKSTWWMAGSENHDLNSKTTNLLTSALFASQPGYASKVYPNRGHDCAPGYHKAGYNAAAEQDPQRDGTGRADWSDGKNYTPADHYPAWVAYLTEYFAERAKRGFFLENGSPGYMRYTISYLLLLYNFCPDERLKQQTKMFLDLFWADWALQQLGGLRGGPKTRHHKEAGGYDAMSDWARFYLGGPGLTTANYAQQLIGDYGFNPMLWEMVIDRRGLGTFAYIARGIGEEEQTCPRPMGVERTMIGDCESRMTKYSWVTPDYVLGTQMDHPLAVHNHLSTAGRWQGLITADPDARIATVSLSKEADRMSVTGEYCVELVYHSVQHKQVLITQQRRRWSQINPDWFPCPDHIHNVPFGIYIGSGWPTRDEQAGWLFLEHEDTYAAVKILRLKADADPMAWAKGTDQFEHSVETTPDSYTWNDSKTIMQLVNRYSPIIIEAGRRVDYPTLADFKRQTLSNKLEIRRTVVTRETRIVVIYKGAGVEEIVFNAANPVDIPTVGGQRINFSHPQTFDSPYLRSDYGSGIVEMSKGDQRQVLDFNTPTVGVREIGSHRKPRRVEPNN